MSHIRAGSAIGLLSWASHLIPLVSSVGFPLNPETSTNGAMKLQWNFKIYNGIILNEKIQCHTAGVAIMQLPATCGLPMSLMLLMPVACKNII